MSDSGAIARFYHAVKVDLHGELLNDEIDEARKKSLELLDGKLLVTNTDAPADEVVQRYKSLADIEIGPPSSTYFCVSD